MSRLELAMLIASAVRVVALLIAILDVLFCRACLPVIMTVFIAATLAWLAMSLACDRPGQSPWRIT